MQPRIRPIRAKGWLSSNWMMLASLSVHALVLFAIYLVIEANSQGSGNSGSANGGTFSAIWLPGEGKGKGRTVDTVIPGTDPPGSLDADNAVEVQPAVDKPPALDLRQTDPHAVFNEQSDDSVTSDGETILAERSRNESHIQRFGSTKQVDVLTVSSRTSLMAKNASSNAESLVGSAKGDGHSGSSRGEGGAESDGAAGDGRSSKAGDNRIEFFGILTRAKRVVYVIDASESMRHHKAMELAKQRLWSSLQELTTTSQFQIVFFNLANHTMNRPGERSRLLAATSSNLRLAKQFLTGIQPDSGTDRFAAMTHALSLEPDVVYLLTDVDAPVLNAKELWDIRRSNKRNAIVHVVEFGIGGDLSQDSFLKKLASQNRGTHHYHDLARDERSRE